MNDVGDSGVSQEISCNDVRLQHCIYVVGKIDCNYELGRQDHNIIDLNVHPTPQYNKHDASNSNMAQWLTRNQRVFILSSSASHL